jgi:hypothetical protein
MNKKVILANAKRKAKQGMPLTGLEVDLLLQAGLTVDTTSGRCKKEETHTPTPKDTPRPPEDTKPEIAPNDIRAHTIGLWKNDRRLLTSPIVKSRLPKKWSRLLFIKNNGKRKDNKQPDYIGYFMDSDAKYKEIKSPYITLRETIEDEFGSVIDGKDESRDLASEITEWIRDHEDEVMDAIRWGIDSCNLYGKLAAHFNE